MRTITDITNEVEGTSWYEIAKSLDKWKNEIIQEIRTREEKLRIAYTENTGDTGPAELVRVYSRDVNEILDEISKEL